MVNHLSWWLFCDMSLTYKYNSKGTTGMVGKPHPKTKMTNGTGSRTKLWDPPALSHLRRVRNAPLPVSLFDYYAHWTIRMRPKKLS